MSDWISPPEERVYVGKCPGCEVHVIPQALSAKNGKFVCDNCGTCVPPRSMHTYVMEERTHE